MKDENTIPSTPSLDATEAFSGNVLFPKSRVALDDIKNAIATICYKNGADLLDKPLDNIEHMSTLQSMTICTIVMKNGFIVIGKAAPADPRNYSKDIGMKNAYEDAVRQLWPLMGFALREHLHQRAVFDAEPKVGEGLSR